METNVLEPQILGTVRKGVPKRNLNADEKLDKICTLLETVISTSLSPPPKSNKLETLHNISDEETEMKNSKNQNSLFHLFIVDFLWRDKGGIRKKDYIFFLNIKSLRCHHDLLKVELDRL